jgi:hypothetical protein
VGHKWITTVSEKDMQKNFIQQHMNALGSMYALKGFAYLTPLQSNELVPALVSSDSSPVACSVFTSESADCCNCCLLGVGDRDEKPESELEL